MELEVTDAESAIAKRWKLVKLKDLCKEKEGLRRGPFGSAIKKEFFVQDGYKVYEQSNAIYDDVERGRYFISEEKYQELINFNVIPGDLIVSCSGTLGRIAEIPSKAKPGVINQALLRIRLLDQVIFKKYFLYYFRSAAFQRKIFDQSQGTAMSNLIGIKDFKEIEVLLPSLSEQREIVAKLEELFSELDKGKEQLETARQQLKVYRQAVLKWAFEGRFTNPEVKEGELSEGWKWVKLKEVATDISDGDHQPPPKTTTGVPFITISNINKSTNTIEFSNTFTVSEEYYKNLKQNRKPTKGDILYTVTGSFGIPVLVDFEKDFCFQRHIGLIRPLETINQKWLFYLLQSPVVYHQAKATATGTAQKTVSLKSLRNFDIPFAPCEEQYQIVQEIESRLSVCDKVEETINQSLLQAETLRQSILKRAFEGKLVKASQMAIAIINETLV
ncbi:restriction endonuclease subunit S [Botryobacter ruber]|uniref:restriction endonuclease subunit S n=1 Tax=Botryobacter ruber TaxID=2171629 RepID=UPI000E0AA52D|nr:restriction endonuclease subunit S [Botryobacter ruber]